MTRPAVRLLAFGDLRVVAAPPASMPRNSELNQPDPLLAKDMNVNTYKGHLWDRGGWDWLDGWKLGDTDPCYGLDTEVD